MAVSGKTAAPHEIPYFLGTDKPPDMAAGTKAIADRVHARLGAVDLSQLVAGSENNGKLLVVSSGAAAYKAMSGDLTMDSAGVTTIGAKKVTTAKLEEKAVTTAKLDDKAVTGAKVDDATLTEAKLGDGAVSSRKLKPTVGYAQATAGYTTLESSFKDIPGAKLEITPPVASKLVVIATWALNVNANEGVGAGAQGTVNLDGVDQSRVGSWGQGGGTKVWLEMDISQTYLFSLSAAAHTIKLRARLGGQTATLNGENSGFFYMLLAS
ncbi:MAG TPA: hypothetical protein VFJ57_01345 [Solirubrobacterales bacterium]|nr:hypothetical protein [Solirubrobacterales bacterium]